MPCQQALYPPAAVMYTTPPLGHAQMVWLNSPLVIVFFPYKEVRIVFKIEKY